MARIFVVAEDAAPCNRSAHAAKDIDTWHKMLPPTRGFVEQCYFHSFEHEGKASIYNSDIHKGLTISFDADTLDYTYAMEVADDGHLKHCGFLPADIQPSDSSRGLKRIYPYEVTLAFAESQCLGC